MTGREPSRFGGCEASLGDPAITGFGDWSFHPVLSKRFDYHYVARNDQLIGDCSIMELFHIFILLIKIASVGSLQVARSDFHVRVFAVSEWECCWNALC